MKSRCTYEKPSKQILAAVGQLTAFLTALIKAVESSPQAALVITLAVGKDLKATDAYREESERAVAALARLSRLLHARLPNSIQPERTKQPMCFADGCLSGSILPKQKLL